MFFVDTSRIKPAVAIPWPRIDAACTVVLDFRPLCQVLYYSLNPRLVFVNQAKLLFTSGVQHVAISIIVSVKIIVLEIVEVHWRKNFKGLRAI